jgi:hypothetical protein
LDTYQHLHCLVDGGNHRSVQATYKKMRNNFYSYGLRQVVEDMVGRCAVCQIHGSKSPVAPLRPILTSHAKEMVCLLFVFCCGFLLIYVKVCFRLH